MESGNFGAAKVRRGGVYELRQDFGPGYPVYYGLDGKVLVILLGGVGTSGGRAPTFSPPYRDGIGTRERRCDLAKVVAAIREDGGLVPRVTATAT
jgi:hypothetical protein